MMTTEEKIKLCRIVGVMLLTDGKLLDAEVDYIQTLMDGLELDDDERGEVMDRIDAGSEVLDDARALSPYAGAVLEALREASRVDGIIAPSEADLIARVSDALDYTPVDD